MVTYGLDEFKQHWISTSSNGEDKGIAMFLETTPTFFTYKMESEENVKEKRSFRFLFGYVKKYRKHFGQIILGLIVGSLLQLILPFLTQSIVDVDIKNQDIGGAVLLQQVGVCHLLVGKFPLWCMDDLVLEAEEGA